MFLDVFQSQFRIQRKVISKTAKVTSAIGDRLSQFRIQRKVISKNIRNIFCKYYYESQFRIQRKVISKENAKREDDPEPVSQFRVQRKVISKGVHGPLSEGPECLNSVFNERLFLSWGIVHPLQGRLSQFRIQRKVISKSSVGWTPYTNKVSIPHSTKGYF